MPNLTHYIPATTRDRSGLAERKLNDTMTPQGRTVGLSDKLNVVSRKDISRTTLPQPDRGAGAALLLSTGCGRLSPEADSPPCPKTHQRRGLTRNLRQALLAGLLLAGIAAAVGTRVIASLPGRRTQTSPRGQSAASRPEADKPAEQVYKNIQVFKGLPASQLDGAMSFMAASLGVACNHCHVAAWESDENAAKQSARRMIEMMRGINKQNYGATPVITCYTCHRGRLDPASSPDANNTDWQQASATSAIGAKQSPLPATEAIVDNFFQAIGGRDAAYNVKTLILKGEQTTTDRTGPPVTSQFEAIHSGADRLLLRTVTAGSTYSYLISGSSGWIEAHGIKRAMNPEERASIKRGPNFTEYLRLTERFPNIRVFGRERLGVREVYSIGAATADGSRQRLYFDTTTGLLLRSVVLLKTALGSLPEITDFEDYRAVEGLKFPFKITWSRPPFSISRSFTEIRLNTPIDDGTFRMPR
jgi:hypothetical protein